MQFFQLVGLLLIGVLSAITQARIIDKTRFGMPYITYSGSGQICSGVHITSWIILTPAVCVAKKDMGKLLVSVSYKLKGDTFPKRRDVKVLKVQIHPKYDETKLEYNYAMMVVNTTMDYIVEKFELPKTKYDTDIVLKENLKTKGQDYRLPKNSPYYRIYDRKVTKNFDTCNEISKAENWFCAERGAGPSRYYTSHIGMPLFFFKRGGERSKTMQLLGIYTGRGAGKELRGHIFENIFSGVNFIETFINENPVPLSKKP